MVFQVFQGPAKNYPNVNNREKLNLWTYKVVNSEADNSAANPAKNGIFGADWFKRSSERSIVADDKVNGPLHKNECNTPCEPQPSMPQRNQKSLTWSTDHNRAKSCERCVSQLVCIKSFLQAHCEQNENNCHQAHENKSLVLEHSFVGCIGLSHKSLTETIIQETVWTPSTESEKVLEWPIHKPICPFGFNLDNLFFVRTWLHIDQFSVSQSRHNVN